MNTVTSANIWRETAKLQTPQGKLQTPQGKSDSISVSLEKTGETADLTQITYPPFLPPGDTQSIFKMGK